LSSLNLRKIIYAAELLRGILSDRKASFCALNLFRHLFYTLLLSKLAEIQFVAVDSK